ncbi:MAG: hypothetical protein Ct9H300mP12_06070 [Acidimicrobiales bacterium]|nr:MAG: hypothetical protein Ct9H300mP12_06070 [Acidimicrobiales bacterium]
MVRWCGTGVLVGRSAAVGAVAFWRWSQHRKKVEMAEIAFVFWRLVPWAFYALVLVLVGNRLAGRTCALHGGGPVFAVNLVFFILSMRRTSAVNAVVIASMQPVLLLAVGYRLFGERPHPGGLHGAVVAFGGVVVAMAGSGGRGWLPGRGICWQSSPWSCSRPLRGLQAGPGELDSTTYHFHSPWWPRWPGAHSSGSRGRPGRPSGETGSWLRPCRPPRNWPPADQLAHGQ